MIVQCPSCSKVVFADVPFKMNSLFITTCRSCKCKFEFRYTFRISIRGVNIIKEDKK